MDALSGLRRARLATMPFSVDVISSCLLVSRAASEDTDHYHCQPQWQGMGPTDQLPEPPLSMSIPPSQGQRMRMTPPSTQLLRSSAPPCSARLVFLSEDVQNSRSIFPRQLRECLEQRQGVTSVALFRWSGNSGDQTEGMRTPIRRWPLQASPRGVARKTRGWIRYFLSCRPLSSPTTCRFSPALSELPISWE
jgi:hypothetical protein